MDLGCGTGSIAQIVRKKGYTYIGLEISKGSLLKASNLKSKGDACFLQGDANYLPCKRCFKLVVATEIIEHLENPYKLLVEINNVLLDGGYLIISTPNKASLEGFKGKIYELVFRKRWTAWSIDHKHIFSSFEFLSLLQTYLRANFLIVRVCGYYFLPKISFTEKIEEKWWFGVHLRFLGTYHKPLNMLGFQIIALLKKASTRCEGHIRKLHNFSKPKKDQRQKRNTPPTQK